MTNNNKFIKDSIREEIIFLSTDLKKWTGDNKSPCNLLYPVGYIEEKICEITRRLSKLDICIEILNENSH